MILRDYLIEFWLLLIVHDKDLLGYLVKLVGEEKVALETECPFSLDEEIAGSLIESIILMMKRKRNYDSIGLWKE